MVWTPAVAPDHTADVISALAPLGGGVLKSLHLMEWTVTPEFLSALQSAMPDVHSLELIHCAITSDAWTTYATDSVNLGVTYHF